MSWTGEYDMLDQLHPQVATNRLGRSSQRAKRYRFVFGIQQSIKLRAAGLHA